MAGNRSFGTDVTPPHRPRQLTGNRSAAEALQGAGESSREAGETSRETGEAVGVTDGEAPATGGIGATTAQGESSTVRGETRVSPEAVQLDEAPEGHSAGKTDGGTSSFITGAE